MMKKLPDLFSIWLFRTATAVVLGALLMLVPASSNAQSTNNILSRYAPALKKNGKQNNPLAIQNIEAVKLLKKDIVNKYSDIYEPVRFMHRKHAGLVKDCTVCHHRVSRVKGDRGGIKVNMWQLKAMNKKPTACSECHSKPFQTKTLARIGLKAAFHRTCIGCHKKSVNAPVGCKDCHGKNVPDHGKLVKLKGNPTPVAVTKECLRCHEEEAKDFLQTVHWKWKGFARSTLGAEKRNDLGKKTYGINNIGISIHGNEDHCLGCHPSNGWSLSQSSSELSKIDCLICHDSTHTYKKDIKKGGVPVAGIDLIKVATKVGKPDRSNCGSCHFSGPPDDILFHGMMNPKLAKAGKLCDVHMGTTFEEMNVRCQYCHKTKKHKMAGMVTRSTPEEGVVSCERCHTNKPHPPGNLLSHHLNKHTKNIACETCHIPVVFKNKEVQVSLDWSKVKKESLKEAISSAQCIKPEYRWFTGKVKRITLGEKIPDLSRAVEINRPVGSYRDPKAKISPFVIHRAKQPVDSVNRYFAVPSIWPEIMLKDDWNASLAGGMNQAGLHYSGKFKFVDTVYYSGVHHEVLPKKIALSCANCHEALNSKPSCGLCHRPTKNVDFLALAREGGKFEILVNKGLPVKNLVGLTDYINFRKLGYAGDPIKVGGRFQELKIELQKEKDEKSEPARMYFF